MPKKQRKQLESWQKEDAKRLKDLWLAFKERNSKTKKVSQESFGEEMEIGGQAMVGQYLNGATPLNISAAHKFAKGLGCNISEFSPTLSQKIAAAATIALPELDELGPEANGVYLAMRAMPRDSLGELLTYAQFLVNREKAAVSQNAAPAKVTAKITKKRGRVS